MKSSRIRKSHLLVCAIAATLAALPTVGRAAGFALVENSAIGQGEAFAGGGAAAADASTVWFNPASMTALPGTVIQGTGHVIAPSFDYTDGGSVQALSPNVTTPLLPGSLTSASGAKTKFVPNLFYKRDLDPDLAFGFSINVPFGLVTDYNPGWIGRYQALQSSISSVNLNPALAWKVNRMLSVGAGLSAMYMSANFTNAIDFNAVCAKLAGAAAAAACFPNGLPGSGKKDGYVSNNADGWGFGYNLGLLFTPRPGTRLSVAWRSQVHQRLTGDAAFTVPAGISLSPVINAAIAGSFANDGIVSQVKLPATLSLSLFQRLTPDWALMADATWTGWSSIQELRISFDRPTTAGGPAVETLDWRDTWRLALGLQHRINDRWTVRAGTAFDQSPVRNAQTRTARLPDSDRIWMSFGASYRYTKNVQFDIGYSHLFMRNAAIDRTGSSGNVLIGSFDSSVDVVSAQMQYRF